ncbi:MAG: DUF3783 domain-containing protein [Kiritimatiellia bacterium]
MPKAETTFRPIGDSAKKMHGHTAVLISGFSAAEQEALLQFFPEWGLNQVPLVNIAAETLSLTLAEATALPHQSNWAQTPQLPRAVIMSGLEERQLNNLMRGYREAGFERPLWASVTPTSQAWTVKYLLVELLKEREAMRQAMLDEKQRQQSAQDTPQT